MALVGNLKDLKLPNLIQLNCMEKNVARLVIESRGETGSLFFLEGQVVHATFMNKVGEEAVHEMLTLKEGLFRIENDITSSERSVMTSWSNLLLEGLRVIDEGKDTAEGKIEDLLQSVLAVKGVIEAEILDDQGEMLASSVDSDTREGYSYLAYFSFNEGQMFDNRLKMGGLEYLNLKTPKSKIVCFWKGEYFVVAEYDPKLQIENILPELSKYQG